MEYKGRVEYRVAVEYKGRVAESLLLPKPGLTGSGCLFSQTDAGSVYSMALYLMHAGDDEVQTIRKGIANHRYSLTKHKIILFIVHKYIFDVNGSF